MKKISSLLVLLFIFFLYDEYSFSQDKFNNWLFKFKKKAINEGVSELTVNKVMDGAVFIPKVIEYDRYQPEFYEDTKTYVSKRVSIDRIKKGKRIYGKNKKIINLVDYEFNVEKELLLALMGIETNYGTYLGKMDIISSLATLSFDERRSEFFTAELITVLKLIDQNKIDKNILYGSWAGAFGNFQFMPSTISKYAIDYNNDGKIDLYTSLEDSFASAANYLKKIGWDKNPWGTKVKLKKELNKNLFTYDARKLSERKKIKNWIKLGVVLPDNFKVNHNTKGRLVKPDGIKSDVYLVLNNYDKLLNWNRSLRFAITIGVFADFL